MKPVIVDASAAAAWLIPDERTDAADQLYKQVRVQPGRFHAPSLWHWETGNLLLMSLRRGRLDPEQVEQGMKLLGACQIEFDPPPDARRRSAILRMAGAHQLTFYDAAYLELCVRLNGQIASTDKALLRAAQACGIERIALD
ncbi:type II toxin-antitoxin system VapC family toxin [Variovorax rhizosphaerae]|uniref:Type II toxin-antitoxin system VapC family toxin n=1 Tax=Variovorax rhizosphaerae TaxID=1836200 RepID=A0ABU8WKJ2_9BURK